MKKLIVLVLIIVTISFQFCTSSRKSKSVVAKTTYATNIQPLMIADCSPCHIPPNNRKKAYDSYASVKGDINDIIKRIQKNPSEDGFMPFRHPKLSDSAINVFVKWKNDGLLEN